MTDIQLDVTLSIVGPRQGLLEKEHWPMALRIAAGFDLPPDGQAATVAKAHEMVAASLPWKLWPADLPKIVLVADGARRIECEPAKPLAEDPAFLEALQDAVKKKGEELCEPLETLDFRCAGGTFRQVDDVSEKPRHVSWPGLLSTLSSLCQPTPSALKATWFFFVARDQLCTLDPATGAWKPNSATLSAAPSLLNGTPIAEIKAGAGATTFEYAGQSRAFCNVLALDAALDAGLDELDNYWLTIRDSRDDSLLDLAHQLDSALTPVAMLGALTNEELLQSCNSGDRRCTAAELAGALEVWRRELGKVPPEKIAEARKEVIRRTLATPGLAVDVLAASYRSGAVALLDALLVATTTPVQVDGTRWEDLASHMAERLLPHAPDVAAPGPANAGEGVTLVVGDERLRLAHETQTATPALDEVAAVQLWARRSTDPAGLAADAATPATWHALTAGRYAMQETPATAGVDRVFGCSAAYVDEVLFREFAYVGSNMVCRNPLERAHREEMGDTEPGLMLAKVDRVAATAWDLLAVPLRYGDHYEFAASVIDRAGGQAAELSEPGEPWKAKLSAIAALDPPQRDRLHFLRRVPVGVCNLLPPKRGWPATPADVVLRCLEREPRPAPGKRSASVCLVPVDAAHYLQPGDGLPGAPLRSEVRFAVEPPQIDEHTAVRWLMPPTNASRDQQLAAVGKVRDVVAAMLKRREEALSNASDAGQLLVMDPAVSAIGIRWRKDDAPGTTVEKVLPAGRREFVVEIGDKIDFDGETTFTVAPGSYLRIGITPLVSLADFERLDAAALGDLIEPGEWRSADGRVFRAFEEDVVFVECASFELPVLDAALLRLDATATGDVDVRYGFSRAGGGARAAFDHVDKMRLSIRRWTWRNLPAPPRTPSDFAPGTDEWRRRLASGPPRELADPLQRDSAPEVVEYFDVLGEIDTGFVGREDIQGTFPRAVTGPGLAAPSADDTVLFRDGRDGITPADYLQYTWTIRSRYAGVLRVPETSTPAPRRIALGFRGDPARIKPPRIFAVMPLLSRMPDSPRTQDDGDATPFLVVLDEIWFREYGIGERLSARIATVKREIGDGAEPTMLRYGPLPDHNLDTAVAQALPPTAVQLDCFGPFGFTLDRGDDQALANATGFIVYPPAHTPAHYNLFVEFERCLDLPSGTVDQAGTRKYLRSETTEALPMYTLPDSAELWPDAGQAKAAAFVLARRPGGDFGYDQARLKLRPFAGASGAVMHQYRYLLIAGNMVRDGGRAVDVFLPARGLWLDAGSARPLGAVDAGLLGCSHGLVAEVLLSGRFDPGAGQVDPLATAGGLADLLERLLPKAGDDDAPAMFRRFSAIGRLNFG